jgi:hypothetical protein
MMTDRKVRLPYEKKSNHVNLYLTDSEKTVVDTVCKEHPDMALGSLFVYSLMKIYSKPLNEDYNAQLVKSLHDWKAQLNADIDAMTEAIKVKRGQLCDIDMLLDEIIKGE